MPDNKQPSEILSKIESARQNMSTNSPDYRVMERIEKIYERLENGEKLGIKELSVEFECATKTIQRDLSTRLPELISRLGLHCTLEKEGRFFKLIQTSDTKRSFSDMMVIDTLERLAEGVGCEFAMRAKKALGRLKEDEENPLYIKVQMEDITDKADEVAALQTAIEKKLVTNFTYLNYNKYKTVEVKPLKLTNFDGYWYLLAIDTKEDVIKKYYLKNISLVSVETREFRMPKGVLEKLEQAINIWFDANSESFEVRLYADADIAKYLKRRKIAKSQRIVSNDQDGGIEVSIMATCDWEITRLVFQWMPNLIVLSPEYLKDDINEVVQEYLDRLNGVDGEE